jgi:hypothetical protein
LLGGLFKSGSVRKSPTELFRWMDIGWVPAKKISQS